MFKKHIGIRCTLFVATLLLLLTGCGYGRTINESEANVKGAGTDWSDFKRITILLEQGESIAFDYDSRVEDGSLSIRLFTESDDVAVELGVDTKDCCKVEITDTGDYYLLIVGNEFVGNYEVKWTISS